MTVKHTNVTLADVGRLVGVSAVTVSNVINNRGGTSLATQAKVWEAVERTGYVANIAARSLAGGKTNTIGVLVPDLSTQYASEIVRGISEKASDTGMELLISTTYDTSLERSQVDFLKKITDGLLFLLPYESRGDIRSFELGSTPIIAIEYRADGHKIPTVNIDDYEGTRNAITYLVSLGHKRIGFIGGPYGRIASETRLKAYVDMLDTAEIALDQTLIVSGDFTQPTGFTATQQLLSLTNPPTAIFAANDLSAFGVIEAVKHHGLHIPQDISIMGFDDVPMASQVFPPLTTVRRPLVQMGVIAVEGLLSELRGEAHKRNEVLSTNLVIRATTGFNL